MQKSKLVFRPFTFIALAISGAPAWANNPEPIHIGVLEVLPTIDTKVTAMGNTWLPNGEEEDAELFLFKPRLAAVVSDGKNQFSSSMEILNGNYSERGVDNFVDLRFESAARFAIDSQNFIKLRSELFNSHETVGSAADAIANRFTTSTLNGSYEYATGRGKGRVVLDAGTFSKSYIENDGLSYLNHEDYTWRGSFYLRVLPGTDMVLQYGVKEMDFLDNFTHQSANIWEMDNTESNAYVGATWQAPATLLGKLKIASGFKETAISADWSNQSSARWETNVRWEPLRDSIVTFNADHIKQEDTGMDSIMDTTSFHYSWEYLWTGRLKSAIAGNYTGRTYLHSNRKDEGLGLKLRMDYAYSTWLSMFVAVGHDEKKSAFEQLNFTQRTFKLGVTATLEHLLGW